LRHRRNVASDKIAYDRAEPGGTWKMSDGFAYTNLFAKNLPAPAVRFAVYPK
jgi:hypothetical protein